MAIRRVRCSVLAVLVVLALVGFAACSPAGDSGGTESNRPPASKACTFSLTRGEPRRSSDSNGENWAEIKEDVSRAERYVDDFWSRHWSECFADVEYRAPQVAGYYTDDRPIRCGRYTMSADNAFYCSQGHFIAYGETLLRRAVDLGDALAYQLVAHEWGHAIQELLRASDKYRSLVSGQSELQADCLAGAALWASDYEGRFEWEQGDTDEVVEAFKKIADKTDWTQQQPGQPARHGSVTQRIRAFETGRSTYGVEDCLNSDTWRAPDPAPSSQRPMEPRSSPSSTPQVIDAAGHPSTSWASPSGNITCEAVPDGGSMAVRCDIAQRSWKAPPRPADCDDEWAAGVMLDYGGPALTCSKFTVRVPRPNQEGTWWWHEGDPTTSSGLAILPYGATVRLTASLQCVSTTEGMQCGDGTNNYGFLVSKEQARLF